MKGAANTLALVLLLAWLSACSPGDRAGDGASTPAAAAPGALADPNADAAADVAAVHAGDTVLLDPAAGSDRYALVFGNGAYRHGDALGAPPRDAALMARALQGRGYHVLLSRDRDLEGMREDLHAFRVMSEGAALRLVYFAGHGFEFDNANYLLPVDMPANIAALDRNDVRVNALRLDQVLDGLGGSGGTLVAIIDACRVVPARGSAGTRTLSAQDTPEGTILAYATAPGQVAMDSLRAYGVDQEHSPYSYYLASVLAEGDAATWDQAFLATYNIVATATRGEQQPWMNAKVNRFPPIGARPGRSDAAAGATSLLGLQVSPDRKAAARYWAREAGAIRRLSRDATSDAALRGRARSGDDHAAIALASRWFDAPEHAAEVVALLEPVAERGHAVAQVDLGTHLYARRAEDAAGRSARHWWTLASAQGIGEARGKLAMIDGDGGVEAMREFMQGIMEMHQAQGSD